MSYDYSENILVQESAGNLLRDELNWDVKFAYNTEVLGNSGTFGRKSYREILLVRYFHAALKKLNPWITANQLLEAQAVLEKRLSTSSLLQINEEKYFLIRDGIPVTVKRPDGKTETKKAAVIDFLHPENNYFLAVKELKIHGDLYRRRTDIVGFVNGLPLLFVELKKNTVDVQNAYDDNYTDYKDTIPHVGGQGGADPTVDKEVLIARILDTIEKAKSFLHERCFELDDLISAVDFMKLSLLQTAANAVCGTIEDKKSFSTYATELIRLMKYTDRADITGHTRKEYEAIVAIYAELQKKRRHVDTTDLMVEINSIISEYVEIYDTPSMVKEKPRRFDISAIDFDLLRREFAKVKKKNLVMKDLEELIQQKIDRMLFNNPDRIDYYERYQQIIIEYNNEQNRATIEKTFMELMNLANSLDKEEQRYVREGFDSDEELSLYDMLFRDDLSKADIKKIKELAASLLKKIKAKIAELDHWTDKQETKAAVDNLIRDTLWAELPECYDEISISEYRQRIYEYVYTRYRVAA